jgi:Holliday junction resolvase
MLKIHVRYKRKESDYQRDVINKYEKDGWKAIKLGKNGWPDYILVGKVGNVLFIEFKGKDTKITPLQQDRIDFLRDREFTVIVDRSEK